MNIVDYIILGVLGISVLFGLYRGFISSVLNISGGFVSFILSFMLYPNMALRIQTNQDLVRTLSHYTDASSRVGDLELAITRVSDLGQPGVAQVLDKVKLPVPLNTILQTNLENRVWVGSGVDTVSGYVSQTILQCSINIICFLVCFLALYAVVSIVLNVVRAVFRFPVLKHGDALAGGFFGFLRGLLICLSLFTLVPLVQTMVPLDLIGELLAESAFAPVFMNGNLITAIMNGRIF